ncbi:hypothetical protein COMNV_01681 [Commensalibacter sp. Nvir]|uniref:baseplate J/gp47 family protein n=1 Tax=Commensalibacter sp. Nvir TaxID=3069817 RepID=UPI002D702DC4|nr:hypothetical protein COMNV_01681 [Commensalibacter sp. Nvir]
MSTYFQNAQTGVMTADTSDLLTEVQQEFISALGENLSLDASTPQGTLMQAETVARTSVMKFIAQSANLLNPEIAYGVYLDAICAFLGIERGVDAYTQIDDVLFNGQANTILNPGVRVQSSKGDLFEVISQVTLGSDGLARGSLRALNQGVVEIAITDSLSLLENVAGLTNVTMDSSTTIILGDTINTDQQLRTKRKLSLFSQALSCIGKIMNNVLALQGVRSVKVVENVTGAAGTVEGIAFTVPYGIWVCVAGTYKDDEVAQALFDAYACRPYDVGTNNGTPCKEGGYAVEDSYSGQSYNVQWVKPVAYYTYIKMTLKQGSAVYSTEAIKEAIVKWAQGNVASDEGFTLGRAVSGFDIAGAVAAQLSGLQIQNCEVYLTTDADAKQTGDYVTLWALKPWEIATTAYGLIEVTLEDNT